MDKSHSVWNSRSIIILILCLSVLFLSDLCYQLQGVSYTLLAPYFGVYPYIAYWVLRGYHIGTIVTTVFGGSFVAAIGPRRTITYSIALLIFLFILAPISTSIGQVIFIRIVEGVLLGLAVNASMGIVGRTFKKERIPISGALTTSVLILSLMILCYIGFYIMTFIGWKWTFYFPIPFLICLLPLTWYYLPKHEKLYPLKADYIFIILIIVFLSSLYYFILYGHWKNWFLSSDITIACSIAFTSLVLMGIYIYKNPFSFFSSTIFYRPSFSLGILLSFCTGALFAMFIDNLLGIATVIYPSNFIVIGEVIGPLISTYLICDFGLRIFLSKHKKYVLTLLSGGTLCVLFGVFSNKLTGSIGVAQLSSWAIIGGAGAACLFASTQQFSLLKLRGSNISVGRTLIRAFYLAGTAIYLCSFKTVFSFLTVMNFNDMRMGVNSYNTEVLQFLSSKAASFLKNTGHDSFMADRFAISSLNSTISREAQIISYVQNSNMVLAFGILVILVTLFVKGKSLFVKNEIVS